MKKIKVFIFIMVSLFIFENNIYAEEDTSCTYKSQSILNKSAYNVEFNYNIRKDETGKTYFEISIYNINDDIYITVNNDNTNDKFTITSSMTTNRVYTFLDYDTLTITNYTFQIGALKYGCNKELRKYVMKKPKYNDISEIPICREESMLDYKYCKEWINSYFKETREEIIDIINKKYNKTTSVTTTICNVCKAKEDMDVKIQKSNRIKIAIIIGIIIGIIIDIAFIIRLLIIIKQSAL